MFFELLIFYFQERSSQARIADLEAQLSRATANVAQMKREKDEVDKLVVLFNFVFFCSSFCFPVGSFLACSLLCLFYLLVYLFWACVFVFYFCLGIFRQKSTKVGFSRWRPSFSPLLIETQKKQQPENYSFFVFNHTPSLL